MATPETHTFGLPEFAGLAPQEPPRPEEREGKAGVLKKRERTPLERAQEMWDAFQDLRRAWRAHAAQYRKKEKDAAPLGYTALFDAPDHPAVKAFFASPLVRALHLRLHALYADPEAREAWEAGMKAHATQWEGINGTWPEYQRMEGTHKALEARYDDLQQERFNERGKPSAERRRTLADDLAQAELSLANCRMAQEALRNKSPEPAAKILASELEARHKELQSKDGFMWFRSRRAIYEALEELVAEKETLRMIILEGQAGTGKNSFVRALARRLTGEDPVEVTIKSKTKVDRQLLADETLDPAHPTVYRPILRAITGKSMPEDEPVHDGRVAFADELNKGDNDEVGDLATVLDGMKIGGNTRYEALGADPKDKVQPRALVIAAQNPAGARFLNRTKFTPEVQRKLDIIQLDYFSQTDEDPELFEAFLVSMKDADGRIQAKKSELAPAWIKDSIKNNAGVEIGTQDKLVTLPTQGGVLWRISEMLHQSYENLYKRKNVLTDENPNAHIQGRVLPPGDVFKWLQGYRKEVKKGTSLESYLSQEFMDWIESSFTADHDRHDKELYLALAEKYGVVKNAAEAGQPPLYRPLAHEPISIDLLTPRMVAELSPRVPRKFIPVEGGARPPEFPRAFIDWTAPDGVLKRGVEIRYEPFPRPQIFRPKGSGETGEEYVAVGIIKQCRDAPALVGQAYLLKKS